MSQKFNHFVAVCKLGRYTEPIFQGPKGRYHTGGDGRIKRTVEKSESTDSSDDEFVTQSVAHIRIKNKKKTKTKTKTKKNSKT